MCAKQVKKPKKSVKAKTKKASAKKASKKKTVAKKAKSKASTAKKASSKKASSSKSKVSTKKKASSKSTATKNKKSNKKATPAKKKSPAKPKKVEAKTAKPKIAKKAAKTKTVKPERTAKNSGRPEIVKVIPKKNSTRKNRKTRYTEKELEYFSRLIDKKLIEAQGQLQFYLDQIKNIGTNADNKLKGLDDGTSTTETEQMYSLAARQRKYIQHLENAKLRIKNKIYGVCRVTGNLISKARLKAVPHATLSIGAKLNS